MKEYNFMVCGIDECHQSCFLRVQKQYLSSNFSAWCNYFRSEFISQSMQSEKEAYPIGTIHLIIESYQSLLDYPCHRDDLMIFIRSSFGISTRVLSASCLLAAINCDKLYSELICIYLAERYYNNYCCCCFLHL